MDGVELKKAVGLGRKGFANILFSQDRTAMSDVTAATLSLPAARDSLHEILREGARVLLAQAVEAEVADWIESHAHITDEAGRRQVVRNGHLPERKLVTPVGKLEIRQPRVHDRRPEGQRETFRSSLLPPWLRKTKSVEELIPFLYLKGISTGDFSEALSAILGPGCPGLSATTVTRLKSVWEQDYKEWSQRSLEGKEYVYVWADGIHTNIRRVASTPFRRRGRGSDKRARHPAAATPGTPTTLPRQEPVEKGDRHPRRIEELRDI